MRIAIVGCGYVADLYAGTLALHPDMELVGVTDRDSKRAQDFGGHHSVSVYQNLDDLLSDERVQIVLNLTNPENHYAVTRAALEAGKHVYSEKPLAMKLEEASELCEIAKQKHLHLSGAPCSV